MTTTLGDIAVGAVFEVPADGPLTRDEIVAYACKYDPHPARLDSDLAEDAASAEVTASEWHVVGLAQVALVKAILTDSLNHGSPGIEEVRFENPAYAGDELRTRIEIARIDPWPRRKGIAQATFAVTVRKTDGTIVLTMKVLTLWPIPTEVYPDGTDTA